MMSLLVMKHETKFFCMDKRDRPANVYPSAKNLSKNNEKSLVMSFACKGSPRRIFHAYETNKRKNYCNV
jgi:hypothetical protein